MFTILRFLLLALFIQPVSLASTPRLYISPMEASKWVLSSDNALRCEIEHEIPRFGKAVFYQEAGRELKLALRTDHAYRRGLEVAFRSITANWKGIQYETELARLKSSGGNQLIDVGEQHARHAYVELEQGFQPAVFFQNPEDDMNHIAAVLSTVNFRDGGSDFAACLARLHPDHFDDVRRATVYFDFDDEFPRPGQEEKVFKPMLDYMKIDSSIDHLVVSGHTDSRGTECYNKNLSDRRARYIYDYLVMSGVEPAMLWVESFGEQRLVKRGRTEKTCAINRRVTVTMHK